MNANQITYLRDLRGYTEEAWPTLTEGSSWVALTQRYWAYVDARLDASQEDGALDYFQDVLDAHQEAIEEAWGIRIVYTPQGAAPLILGTGLLDEDTLADEAFWESVPVAKWVQEAYAGWDACNYTYLGQEA